MVFAGCKDWLDVTPAGQATESDLFSTGDGYRSVLNGLYKSMGKPELYGRNWSYGMLDCMAQLYNLESGSFNDEMCKTAAKYEYTNTQVSSSIESAWGIAYNIIANANDLLQNIENASNDIFAGRRNGKEDDHGRGVCLSGLDSFLNCYVCLLRLP